MLKAAYIVPHPPILLPEIGKKEEEKISLTRQGYETIAKDIARIRPQTIVICSPHAPAYMDYIHISDGEQAYGDMRAFGCEQVQFHEHYDVDFINALCSQAQKSHLPAGTLGNQEPVLDHGTMVPLYFIEQAYRDFQIVRIAVSGLDRDTHIQFGECIYKAATSCGKDVVLIASGDLSHKLKKDGPYGYTKEGPAFDEAFVKLLKADALNDITTLPNDICEKSAQCGLPAFQMMLGAVQHQYEHCQFLSYEGAFGVGYATAIIRMKMQDPYVALARKALETYVKEGRILRDDEVEDKTLCQQHAAVFVSIQEKGQLRGCIGTLQATKEHIAQEIISNAIAAGSRDPRFPPVQKEELAHLVYHVDVLCEPEQITSFAQLDVKRYGIIVSDAYHQGVLLPDLEGVDTIQQQVAIALHKAGIDENASYTLERFEVIRHEECRL